MPHLADVELVEEHQVLLRVQLSIQPVDLGHHPCHPLISEEELREQPGVGALQAEDKRWGSHTAGPQMEPPRCPHPSLSFSRAEQDEQACPHPGSVGTDPYRAVNTAAGERSAGRLRVGSAGAPVNSPPPDRSPELSRGGRGCEAGVAEDRSQRSGAAPELPGPVGLPRHRHTVSHRPGPRHLFLLPPCSGRARLCFASCERPSPATHLRYPRDRSTAPPPPHRPFSAPGAHRQQRVGSETPGMAAAPSGLLVPYRERGTAAAALTLGRCSHLRRAAGSMA